MPGFSARALLRSTAARLSAVFTNPSANRGLARKINATLAYAAMPRDVDVVVQTARQKWRVDDSVAIDPEETSIRQHADGLEVRAWLLIRHHEIPALTENGITRASQLLDGLPELTLTIFLLSQSRGYSYGDIGAMLRMSPRKVRRHMLRAVVHIAANT